MKTLLKFASGAFFLASSVFCFLAFHPYTYMFLVKAPPYHWLIWYIGHAPLLYPIALFGCAVAFWEQRKRLVVVAAWIAQLLAGIPFVAGNVLANLRNDWTAYAWSIATAVPMLLLCAADLRRERGEVEDAHRGFQFPYSYAVIVGLIMALISEAAPSVTQHLEGKRTALNGADAELLVLVVAAHVWLALLALSALNIAIACGRAMGRDGAATRRATLLWFTIAVLQLSTVRFLRSALGFDGWPVQIYAGLLASFVTCWSFSWLGPLVGGAIRLQRRTPWAARAVVAAGFTALAACALLLPGWIRPTDWNGFFEGALMLACWAAFGLVVYVVRPFAAHYAPALIVAVLLVSNFGYALLKESAFLWAKRLGRTDGEVSLSLEDHEARNQSFSLVRSAFRGSIVQDCDENCRILRQYTNIPNARAEEPLQLVDRLAPSNGPKPNIFIIVVDSLRPDYLGAYNPAADFTPNIDALAGDSIVMRNAFTQYAGTSLSVPAIWSGALLLHAHYMRPFENVNSLRTLARTDGYRMVVSYDHILKKLIAPEDDVVKLDAEKQYNEIEINSTVEQLAAYLDRRSDTRPILFYTQPMNIHVLGINHLPQRSPSNWRDRPGFNNRIAFKLHQVDEALGTFVRLLKQRKLYENSIIVVTADHGEAIADLPGLGQTRRGHSAIIFPEVMRVPLIIHLPPSLAADAAYDTNRVATLTDITPTLYALLGHGPIRLNPILGQPVITHSAEELKRYRRDHLLLASDCRAAYGVLTADLRYMYVSYASPPQRLLFDLQLNPNATRNFLTQDSQTHYDRQILDDLQSLADFYHYQPNGGSSGLFAWDNR